MAYEATEYLGVPKERKRDAITPRRVLRDLGVAAVTSAAIVLATPGRTTRGVFSEDRGNIPAASAQPNEEIPVAVAYRPDWKDEVAATDPISVLQNDGLQVPEHLGDLTQVIDVHSQSADGHPEQTTIYNYSPHEVNVKFTRFISGALTLWTKDHILKGIDIKANAHAMVMPNSNPHMIILGNKPPLQDDPYTFGETIPYPQLAPTVSEVDVNFPVTQYEKDVLGAGAKAYAEYSPLGVEECQSLVHIKDTVALPGRSTKPDMQFVGASINSAVEKNDHELTYQQRKNLTYQEIACNSLGRILTGLYFSGPEKVKKLFSWHLGLDGNLANSDMAGLMALKEQINN